MKAIAFSAPIPTYIATLAASRLSDSLFVGPHACTRYTDMARPDLPAADWVRVRTRLGGICGSDLAIVTLTSSPSSSPFSSFPFVLGHENVGEVVETGADASDVPIGQRVVVNPLLCCETRRIAPVCDACSAGDHQQCSRVTDGALPAGLLIGTTRGTGGSWGEEFVAHRSQLVPMPDHVDDESAVLVEPFACSVHAVRTNRPRAGQHVLVVGAGSIGLLTVAALKALEPRAHITLLARHEFQAEAGRSLGCDRVVRARDDYLDELAEVTSTRLLKPIIGERIGVGGVDQTYVCIGGTRGMVDALRFTRQGGTVVLLGGATKLDGVDWTPLWTKEISLRGSLCYGNHAHTSPAKNAFVEAAELISAGTANVRPLVTHVFPLSDYRNALRTAMSKDGEKSVKVAFKY